MPTLAYPCGPRKIRRSDEAGVRPFSAFLTLAKASPLQLRRPRLPEARLGEPELQEPRGQFLGEVDLLPSELRV